VEVSTLEIDLDVSSPAPPVKEAGSDSEKTVEPSLNERIAAKEVKVDDSGVPSYVNKRRHSRYPAKWRLTGENAKKISFEGGTLDVSLSGVSIVTTKPLKAGERAYIKMSTYEYGKKRVIDCVIVISHASISNNTYRSGAEFVMMSKSNKEFLSRLIQRMNPHEKDDSCALRKITFN